MENLAPGQTLYVQKETDKGRHPAKVIGKHENEYLLVEIPHVAGVPLFTQRKEICLVRLLDEGRVTGFRCTVEKILFDPFPLMILAAPTEIQTVEVREWSRLNCHIQTRVNPRPNMDIFEDETHIRPNPYEPNAANFVDLSEGGGRLAIPIYGSADFAERLLEHREEVSDTTQNDYDLATLRRTYGKKDAVRMVFSLPAPASGDRLTAVGEVRWVKETEENFFMGICFVKPSDPLLFSIRLIIKHQNAYFTSKIVLPDET